MFYLTYYLADLGRSHVLRLYMHHIDVLRLSVLLFGLVAFLFWRTVLTVTTVIITLDRMYNAEVVSSAQRIKQMCQRMDEFAFSIEERFALWELHGLTFSPAMRRMVPFKWRCSLLVLSSKVCCLLESGYF